MKLLNSFNISTSAMTAERLRLDLISGNIANINTTRTEAGGPYRRKTPVFAEKLAEAWKNQDEFQGRGVQVVAVNEDQSPPRMVYDPTHPDANADGYVAMPNINITLEMINMMTATRSYEANVTAFNAAKQLAVKALEIGRV